MTDPLRFLHLLVRYGRYPKFCERLRRIVAVEWLRPHLPAVQHVLEIGAGDGQTVCFLARQFPDKTFAACEPDRAQAARLEARLAKQRLTNVTVRAVAFDASFDAARFDLIYAMDVLEHVADDRAFLADVRARLRPGGLLFLHVPVPGIPQFEDPGHRRAGYEMDGLRDLLVQQGFTVARMEYTFGWRGMAYHHSRRKLSRWRRMLIHLLDAADPCKVRSEIGVMAVRN
ncbi:MAG: class I SAM-dependent methyltransferase [Candidatus Sumerlaeia bacterium]|nr:class I SAM-dependent methyltransferase [Candidatus Sumerlaeia bacterium]